MKVIDAVIQREAERCVEDARKVSSYGPDVADVIAAIKEVLRNMASRKAERIDFLERKREVTINDGQLKLDGDDWHGVADAAMDLRDIDNELDGLKYE